MRMCVSVWLVGAEAQGENLERSKKEEKEEELIVVVIVCCADLVCVVCVHVYESRFR